MAKKKMLTQSQKDAIFAKLPERCYSVNVVTNEIIGLIRGETGYCPINWAPAKDLQAANEWCDLVNANHDITKAQRKAMEMGSQFGWDTDVIDPDYYMNLEK